jgi:hypothetical protein
VRFALQRKKRVLCAVMRVDLNPARAAICDSLIDSDYTSIQRRLQEREGIASKASSKPSILDRPLKPVAGLDADGLLAMTESSYIEIVQWTGEQARSDKCGQLKPVTKERRAAPADIRNIFDHPNDWLRQVRGTESIYYRAIGSADALMEKAEQLGQVWMKGVASEVAKRILRERPT